MNRVTSKFVPALVALVALFVAGSSQAAVITMTYVSGQISTTSNFASGSVTTVSLAGSNPTVTMTPNEFFRFGMQIAVTGNTDPAAGQPWDMLNQSAPGPSGGTPLPANLGLAVANMSIGSSDAAGNQVAPLSSSGNSTALVGASGQTWAGKTSGNVSGGLVGNSVTIFEGNGGFDYTSSVSTQALGYNTTAANFFSGLKYGTTGAFASPVTLSPTLIAGITNIWHNTNIGDATSGDPTTNPPTFSEDVLTGADTVNQAPPIVIQPLSVTPEPASMGLLGLGLMGLLARRRAA